MPKSLFRICVTYFCMCASGVSAFPSCHCKLVLSCPHVIGQILFCTARTHVGIRTPEDVAALALMPMDSSAISYSGTLSVLH